MCSITLRKKERMKKKRKKEEERKNYCYKIFSKIQNHKTNSKFLCFFDFESFWGTIEKSEIGQIKIKIPPLINDSN